MFLIEFSSLSHSELIQLADDKLRSELPDWEKNIWQFICDWFNPSITSIKIFTSGSTGAPKQIEHSKRAMLNSSRLTCNAFQLKQNDFALLCLPVNKIAGIMMLVRSIYARLNLYCLPPSANPLKDLTGEINIDFAAFTPMQLFGITENKNDFEKAARIKKILLGGENVSTTLQQAISNLPNDVYMSFGMTETISHIALKKLNGNNADLHFEVLPEINISANEENCLVIEAPVLGQPRLVTNDVVKIFSPKEFDWLGRIDNVINSGGIKIQAEELEKKLHPHITIPFFVGAVADARTGEQVILAIESENITDKEKEKLQEAFLQFDKTHRPKSILLFEKFARTENGKIKRKETLKQPAKIIY